MDERKKIYMNTKSLANSIQIYFDSSKRLGHTAEFLRPFILAYLDHPGLQKKYRRFALFNHYIFRTDIICPELFNKKVKEEAPIFGHFPGEKIQLIDKLLHTTEMFVGFRCFHRHYVPFFVSLTSHKDYSQRKYSVTSNFHITGFATYTADRDYDWGYFDENLTTNLSTFKETKKILKDWTIAEDCYCTDTEKQIYKIAKKSSYFGK